MFHAAEWEASAASKQMDEGRSLLPLAVGILMLAERTRKCCRAGPVLSESCGCGNIGRGRGSTKRQAATQPTCLVAAWREGATAVALVVFLVLEARSHDLASHPLRNSASARGSCVDGIIIEKILSGHSQGKSLVRLVLESCRILSQACRSYGPVRAPAVS